MHVRNEQWILECALPAALRFVDEIVVLDHESTDRTPRIIDRVDRDHPGRVHRAEWTGRHYNEMGIRQRSLEAGREAGGTHFFWIDADEIVTANLIEPIRTWIADLAPGERLELPWLAMWASLDRFRDDDSVWTNNFKAFAFADHPDLCYRSQRDGYDMHQQTPNGVRSRPIRRPLADQSRGGVMHLQFANRRRLIAKHAWYKMSETVRFPGRKPAAQIDATYNQALDETGLRLADTPPEWWGAYDDLRGLISMDDQPWHELEVLRFWQEQGHEAFAGLNLWGLPQRLASESNGGEEAAA
ncbi:MAG: glycosyltransferase family 2 protein [Phycisphaeraceae bacterium]|nr:MAG: glycosyltransferase family 2 protein [Phycisphaeraceae bacterium]